MPAIHRHEGISPLMSLAWLEGDREASGSRTALPARPSERRHSHVAQEPHPRGRTGWNGDRTGRMQRFAHRRERSGRRRPAACAQSGDHDRRCCRSHPADFAAGCDVSNAAERVPGDPHVQRLVEGSRGGSKRADGRGRRAGQSGVRAGRAGHSDLQLLEGKALRCPHAGWRQRRSTCRRMPGTGSCSAGSRTDGRTTMPSRPKSTARETHGEGRPDRPSRSRADGAHAQWRQMERMFHEAAALPAERRREWLRAARQAEPELCAHVESLLRAEAGAAARIDRVIHDACLAFAALRNGERLVP